MSVPLPGAGESGNVVRAAGGVVLRAGDSGGWEVAVVHRPEHLDWTLPKGKLELGRASRPRRRCARCSRRPATSCHLGRFVGEVEYLDRRGRVKIVSYWLDAAGPTAPSSRRRRWTSFAGCSLADAVGLLSYPTIASCSSRCRLR